MKKLLVLLLIFLTGCQSVIAPEYNLKPSVKQVRSENYSVSELESKSDLLVRVKVNDQIGLDNSTVNNAQSFYSLRKLEVLEVFRQSSQLSVKKEDELILKEAVAVDTNKIYYTSNHYPLTMDHEYILHLHHIGDNTYLIVDGDNGVINLESLIHNQNIEVTINIIFKYFPMKLDNQVLSYRPLKKVSNKHKVVYNRYVLSAKDRELPVRLGKDSKTNKEYLMIGQYTFEVEGSLLEQMK